MRTHRVVVNEWKSGTCGLTSEAKALIKNLPCRCKAYELNGGDGSTATVTVFPQEDPPLALISPESATWAEEFVDKFVKDCGELRDGEPETNENIQNISC